MASGKSTFLRNRELNYLFNGGAAVVVPANIWIRLYTTTLTPGGVGTEVVAASYDQVSIPLDATNFPVTSDGELENALQVAVGVAEEDWGELLAWGAWDAETGGNLWYWGDIAPGIEISEGAVMVIPAGMLKFKSQATA